MVDVDGAARQHGGGVLSAHPDHDVAHTAALQGCQPESCGPASMVVRSWPHSTFVRPLSLARGVPTSGAERAISERVGVSHADQVTQRGHLNDGVLQCHRRAERPQIAIIRACRWIRTAARLPSLQRGQRQVTSAPRRVLDFRCSHRSALAACASRARLRGRPRARWRTHRVQQDGPAPGGSRDRRPVRNRTSDAYRAAAIWSGSAEFSSVARTRSVGVTAAVADIEDIRVIAVGEP